MTFQMKPQSGAGRIVGGCLSEVRMDSSQIKNVCTKIHISPSIIVEIRQSGPKCWTDHKTDQLSLAALEPSG